MEQGSTFRARAEQIILTIRRKAVVTTTLFALLFSAVAVAQWLFVRHQLYSAAWAESIESASRIAREIANTNGLDMQAVRNAAFPVREWYIVGASGSCVDLEGSTLSIVGRVRLPTEAVFTGPRTYVSDFGDTWRLFARKLNGGTLVVGLADPSEIANPDAKLLACAAKFGTTLQEALRVNPKRIDWAVDYALIGQEGELVEAWGQLPLHCDPNYLTKLLSKPAVTLDGKPYILASSVVYDSAHKPLATVVVPRQTEGERNALRSQWYFNGSVAALAWFVAVAIALAHFAKEEARRSRVHPSLTEARQQGEGDSIEFKRSLLWDHEHGHEDEHLRLKILKTIAAFLNSGGGTLFIGVQDNGQPWGLENDLNLCNGSEDEFHLRLRNSVAGSIGEQFARYIMTSIVDDPDHAGYRICVVSVEGARRAAFLKAGTRPSFCIRSGPRTSELDVQSAYRYIREAGLLV